MSEPSTLQPLSKDCVCRACMVQGDDMDFLYDASIKKKFIFCTGLEIAESDELPTHICRPCSALLDLAHRFKTTCLNADAALRKTVSVKLEMETDSVDSIRDADWTFDDKCGVKKEPDAHELKKQKKIKKEKDFAIRSGVKKAFKKEVKTTKKAIKEKKSVRKKTMKEKMYVEIEVGNEVISTEDLKVKIEPVGSVEKPALREKRCATKVQQPLWCSICQIKFPDKQAEKDHNSANHKRSCVCEYCGKYFEDRTMSYYHIQSHQTSAYPCDKCSYTTGYKYDLRKHMRIHSDTKQYQCELCPNAYHNASNLRCHVQSAHEGRRDYACPVCAHKFFEKDKMRRHLDTHSNIKRYTCGVCGVALSRRPHYLRHMMRQHGIRLERLRPGKKRDFGVEPLLPPDAAPLADVPRSEVAAVAFALEAPFADPSRYWNAASEVAKGDRGELLSRSVEEENGGITASKVVVRKNSGPESTNDIVGDTGNRSGDTQLMDDNSS